MSLSLMDALHAFQADTNAQTEHDFAHALEDSKLLLPIKEPVDDGENQRMQYVAVQSEEGAYFLPLFSSVEERALWTDGPKFLMEFQMPQLRQMLPDMKEMAGIVIDFSSPHAQVLTIENLRQLALVAQDEKKQDAFQRGEGYSFYALEKEPEGLSDALADLLRSYPSVKSAGLVLVLFDGLDSYDYLLTLDASDQLPAELHTALGEAMKGSFPPGTVVHIGPVDILDDDLRASLVPLYKA